jgi:GAF domain
MLMVAGESQNLPGVLEQAEAVYRDAAAQLSPVTGEMLTQRARHFAAGVRISLDQPEAMWRLHEVTGGLRDVCSVSTLLPEILDGALSLTGADFGNIQLLDPVTGSLRIVTQSGFDAAFLEYFAIVDDDHSACGRPARDCAQIVIADVTTDLGFAPHRGIATASGFRAVQSTPLADHAGRLVGMVSTHFGRPHRPTDLDLQIMELYADFAGEAIAAHLRALDGNGPGDPIGRAVISALLDPGDGHVPGVAALPGPRGGRASRERGPVREAASLEDTLAHFAAQIATRLFSVGLSLESAHSIIGNGPAGDRVAAATDQVDRLIGDIRTTVFSLAADRTALPEERMVQTAHQLQVAALDAAALLEQQADLARQPGRMDYPAEIKRWRAFADQAEQMAKRWEQQP